MQPPRHTNRGAALIIVLGFIVILLVLTLSVLRRASTERTSVEISESGASARKLAESVVGLAQAQLQIATTQPDTLWATQPGMVRVFGNDGNLITAFKLYSAAQMTTSAINLSEDAPPTNWASQKGQWIDLNQPREVDGIQYFPIIDPGPENDRTDDLINGFEIDSAPGATTDQPIPMPVRWLYLLADGTLLAADGGSGENATFTGPNTPTKANPIIGRIAFWTDDETCKINVNTASFPTYFDTPRFQSAEDQAFAARQPVLREYQRYPGHPSTTSLAALFESPDALSAESVFGITPRLIQGGSQEGSVVTTPIHPNPPSNFQITLDSDRLYASAAEILFEPNRDLIASINPDDVRRAGFFLTASSRSPEFNPFGLPKIAAWPIHSNSANTHRTAYDRLIARCAEINGEPYFFQRNNADSSTSDWDNIARNQDLYGYLQTLTEAPIPGIAAGGETIATKMDADRDQMLTQIFDYIRSTNLYDDNLAATSGGAPFTEGRNGLTLNPGHGMVTPIRINDTQGFGRFFTLSELAFHFIANADPGNSDSNDPSNVALGGTLLAGSGSTRERLVQMVILPELFSAMQGYTQVAPDMTLQISGLSGLRLNGQELFPNDTEEVRLNPQAVEAVVPVGGYGGFRMLLQPRETNFNDRRRRIPARGPIPADPGLTTDNAYPFVSIPIRVADDTMTFTTGPITVRIFAGNSTTGDPVQELTIEPPASANIPTPALVTAPPSQFSNTPENWWGFNNAGIIPGSPGRMNFAPTSPGVESNDDSLRPGGFIRGPFTDVVRSVVVANGDFRLVQAQEDVPASYFTELGDWSSTTYLLHTLREAATQRNVIPGANANYAPYHEDFTYGTDTGPDFPAGFTASPQSTGDFDTGVGSLPDGPFINKPDEGSIYRTSASTFPYFNTLEKQDAPGPTFFSPARIMPSPGMFGSLPTHVKRNEPWRTLLFRPQPSHPNAQSGPPDHVWMEFFWVPIVEPYAISEPFSTDGKVNLNYQILPFTYITRETAIRAVLAEEKIPAVPNTRAANYKNGNSIASNTNLRRDIDLNETLAQFQAKFGSGDIFRIPSQICEIPLIPAGQSAATINTFWSNHALTGDNLRERPYTTIYPRVTTRSNSFTVHYRVQALRKSPNSDPSQWDGDRDLIEGEAMGFVVLERYLDPNNDNIPDYASSSDPLAEAPPAEFYRWRVIRNQLFDP